MIQIENILKIVDIQKNQISIATWHYLNNFFIAYRDEKLREHLINITDAYEDVTSVDSEFLEITGHFSDPNASNIIKEVTELNNLCQKNDSGYVLFIEG